MDKLREIGFVRSATAVFDHPNPSWAFKFEGNKEAANILYAFVFHRKEEDSAEWQVRYIGHTRKTFGGRMLGYQNGAGKAVNNRMHEAVKAHLTAGGNVDVFVLPDHFGVKIFDLPVDIAAGLEYALIAHYSQFNEQQGHSPLVNRAGNPTRVNVPDAIAAAEAAEEKQAEEEDYIVPPQGGAVEIEPDLPAFKYVLGKTYWNYPSINVPIRYQEHFGAQGTQVQAHLDMGDGRQQTIVCLVCRQANNNGAPRLFFSGEEGRKLQTWKHRYFQENAEVVVAITAPNQILLSLP